MPIHLETIDFGLLLGLGLRVTLYRVAKGGRFSEKHREDIWERKTERRRF